MFNSKKTNSAVVLQNASSIPASIKNVQRGMVSIPDIIAPSSVEVDFSHIRVGEKYYILHILIPNTISMLRPQMG